MQCVPPDLLSTLLPYYFTPHPQACLYRSHWPICISSLSGIPPKDRGREKYKVVVCISPVSSLRGDIGWPCPFSQFLERSPLNTVPQLPGSGNHSLLPFPILPQVISSLWVLHSSPRFSYSASPFENSPALNSPMP